MDSVQHTTPFETHSNGLGRPPRESESLVDLYNRYFEVVPADSDDRLDEAYRLRYQVYCVENPFENADEHLDGREVDEYDDRSVHSLLIHRSTGAVAGTVRLILPEVGKRLPITHTCRHPILSNLRLMPPEGTAEISRFAVSKQFRRRATDKLGVDQALVERRAGLDGKDRRVIAHITLGLMKAIVQMSWKHGITHWTAVMEPALLRLIARLGLKFNPLGPVVEYHGLRQPCYGDANVVLAGMRLQSRDAWALITEGGEHFPWSATEAPQEIVNSGTENQTRQQVQRVIIPHAAAAPKQPAAE